MIGKPVHTKAGHAAHDQVSSLDRLLHFGAFAVVDAMMQGSAQIYMVVVFPQTVDDRVVQRTSDQTNLMSVFEKGKREGRRICPASIKVTILMFDTSMCN